MQAIKILAGIHVIPEVSASDLEWIRGNFQTLSSKDKAALLRLSCIRQDGNISHRWTLSFQFHCYNLVSQDIAVGTISFQMRDIARIKNTAQTENRSHATSISELASRHALNLLQLVATSDCCQITCCTYDICVNTCTLQEKQFARFASALELKKRKKQICKCLQKITFQ